MAEDWQPVEKVAKNDKGEYQAFVGGAWSPVSKVAKNDAGAYVAMMPPVDLVSQIPNNYAPAPPPDKPESLLDKAKGVGEAALTIGTGALAAPVGMAAGIGDALTGSYFGSKAGVKSGEDVGKKVAGALTYQPRTQAGQRYLGNAATALDESKLAGLNPATAMEVSGAIAPAAAAVRQGAGEAASGIKTAATTAAKAAIPKVAPDVAALGRRAQELGIHLRPDMLTDNKFMRMIGEAFEKVPLSGSKTEQRQQAFNRALMDTIGAEDGATRLTPDVFERAFNKSGKTIGDISKRTPVPLDDTLNIDLQRHLANGSKETADVAKIVSSYVQDLQKASENGTIPGVAFRKINSELGTQIRGSSNGDLRRALGSLQEDMHEALSRQLSPQDLATLQDARKKYAISVKLIPMVSKSPRGDISPAGLMQAVTADKTGKRAMATGRGGDVGELAKIGQLFLKEPASSGTAERTAAFGIMSGGAYAEPMTTTGIYGAANIYNRAGPAIARRMTGADAVAPASGIVSP